MYRLMPLVVVLVTCCWLVAGVQATQTGAADAARRAPIRLVVPFPPGGGGDFVARSVGYKLGEILGRQVVIDNRGGGGTTLASDLVAKAQPDGNTLLIVGTAHAVNPTLHEKLPYDTERDFAPVSPVTGGAPLILVVHPGMPARSVKELIALAKSKPGQLNYSSPGNGSPTQLAAEMFKSMAAVDIMHIPYKGSSQAITDLVGGQVQLSFGSQSATPGLVKEGRLRALAVTTVQRSRLLPEVPTMAESGLPDYEFFAWQGIIAPARTPYAVVHRLNQAVVMATTSPEVKDKLMNGGYDVWVTTPEAFTVHITKEIRRWKSLAGKIGARLD